MAKASKKKKENKVIVKGSFMDILKASAKDAKNKSTKKKS